MRRAIGIGGLQKQVAANESFKVAGESIAAVQNEEMQKQLELFKKNLEEFSKKYKNDINKNPILRKQFNTMCTAIGVDPLASSKGFWTEMLGIGNFYYELAIQVVETCMILQEQTGGITGLDIIKKRIHRLRSKNTEEITDDDIVRAVETLKPLGSGYAILDLGRGKKVVQSVPLELSADNVMLLKEGEIKGYINSAETFKKLGWSIERYERALKILIEDGLVWIDDHYADNFSKDTKLGLEYWFPCFFPGFQ